MKETVKAVVHSAPPTTLTVTAFVGVPWQQWVYILGAVYWAILIFRSFPKMYGCCVCFYRNRTCKRNCRDFAK